MSPGPRRLYAPRRATVRAGGDGVPLELAGVGVEAVREEWLVEDRWWTPQPLRRRYFELVLADGRDVTVFEELAPPRHARTRSRGHAGQWFLQRG
jgi:hypothetical protein